MKKRTITDYEFINLTTDVMKKPPISDLLEGVEELTIIPLIFSAALCAELFGEPDTPIKEPEIPFETVFEITTRKMYSYIIYHGGVVGNKYLVRVTAPCGEFASKKRYFDPLKDAYEYTLRVIVELS